ncbi:hypothetical protein AZH53_09710 [Methanomicrobiaceae archaeon CYW5]|uniref:hypothetical protein n=1 Tax=Methanovulcanius yangii TaxID=1789227 RepID=UPI0029C9D9EB|nr:hypothetical protein [Methanovulcanius yangii]MBT8508679.1 hypothetical protein [Methanovulcanius yangii]
MKMVGELTIKRELMADLLRRTMNPEEEVREAAIEALAVVTEDEDWRPNELVRQNGVAIVMDLLGEENPHIVASAVQVLMATAAAGEDEAVLSGGAIACLDAMRDHDDPLVRETVRKALWLLEPEVEEAVVTKPQDEY